MFFKRKSACSVLSMHEAQRELTSDTSIRLIDVRTQEEYGEGHIPGSLHLPLDRLPEITRLVPDKSARLFVYCLSGARSEMACAYLARLGYADVTNIGGIAQWKGEVERQVGA